MLCAETDLDALWAARELAAAGLAPLELVTAGMLASALRWSHEIEASGGARVEIALADGRVIRSEEVAGVFNRLTYVPPPGDGLQLADSAYAAQEWQAFLVSWLHCLPGPVLNRVHPLGLSGSERPAPDWTHLAAQAGLPVIPWRSTAAAETPPVAHARLVWVVGPQVLGTAPEEEAVADGCRRLAHAADCALLGIGMCADAAGGWRFSTATALPPLRPGGPALIAALAAALRAGADSPAAP